MCNAWNHPVSCTCDFGPGSYSGGGWSGRSVLTGYDLVESRADRPQRLRWHYDTEDICRRATCRKCGAAVFFVRHNGGSVWFDDLGKPWPKHGCFLIPYTRNRVNSAFGNTTSETANRLREYAAHLRNPVFGLVTQMDLVPFGEEASLWFRKAGGERTEVFVTMMRNDRLLIGEPVLISEPDRRLICINKATNRSYRRLGSYIVGQRYQHETFGIGVLLAISEAQHNRKHDQLLTIRFEDGKERRFIATVAHVRPLDR